MFGRRRNHKRGVLLKTNFHDNFVLGGVNSGTGEHMTVENIVP